MGVVEGQLESSYLLSWRCLVSFCLIKDDTQRGRVGEDTSLAVNPGLYLLACDLGQVTSPFCASSVNGGNKRTISYRLVGIK